MKRAPGGCPDLESIAAFLDNRLSKRERARVAAERIEKKALERRTPDALHALGVADLVTGDVNRAVPVLEEAARQRAASAGLLSDLAAAYLARAAAHGDQPEDVAKALAAAD